MIFRGRAKARLVVPTQHARRSKQTRPRDRPPRASALQGDELQTTRRRSAAHGQGISSSSSFAVLLQAKATSHLPILLFLPSNGSNGTVKLY